MSQRLFGLAALAAMVAAPLAAWAIPVGDGASVVNDFEVIDRWNVKSSTQWFRNCSGLSWVPEGGGHLYASVRTGLAKYQIPTPAAGVAEYPKLAERATGGAKAYDPVYNGGVLIQTGTYMNATGISGGTDNVLVTVDAGDVVLSNGQIGPTNTSNYHNGLTYVPAEYTWTNNDAYFGVNRTLKTLRQFELNAAPDPDQLMVVTVPGRSTANDFVRNVVIDLGVELSINTPRGVQFAEYDNGVGVLYVTNPNPSETYNLVAITAGPDGKFGANAGGVNDDVAVGYYFGETGEGNSYSLQRQNITSEVGAGAPTDELDIDGSYSTGFEPAAFDYVEGVLYLHGGGDGAYGIVMKDISWRTEAIVIPEPAGLSLLGLALVGLKRRKRS